MNIGNFPSWKTSGIIRLWSLTCAPLRRASCTVVYVTGHGARYRAGNSTHHRNFKVVPSFLTRLPIVYASWVEAFGPCRVEDLPRFHKPRWSGWGPGLATRFSSLSMWQTVGQGWVRQIDTFLGLLYTQSLKSESKAHGEGYRGQTWVTRIHKQGSLVLGR